MSDTPAESMLEVGEESKLLTSAIDADVGPIIDLIDQLRAVGIEKDMQIPQIAVMGDQSSGKSSVLEALSGIPFPRGSGLVTRCATELRMKRAPPGAPWAATVRLSWGQAQPSMAGDVDTVEDLGERISKLTEAMLLARGGATFEAEHSIVIELAASTVPDLTVIDLPGIVRTQVKGQSGGVMREVDGLLERYLKQERTIILCVVPANVDIATVDILERASKVDPDGVRTIGVITKPDTIGEGNEGEVVQVVRGQRKPLKLGYLMVKNRSQLQVEQGVTLLDARALEADFFRKHAHFHSLDHSYLGIESLMSRLTGVLVGRIQEGLPSMRREVVALREQTAADLAAMGRAPPGAGAEACALMAKLSRQATRVLSEAVNGEYSSSVFDADEMRMMAQIRTQGGPQDRFRRALLDCAPTNEWEVPALRAQIASMRGRELPGFLNWRAFDILLKKAVRQWKAPAIQLLQAVKSIIDDVCDHTFEAVAAHYRQLAAGMKQVAQDEMEERVDFVRDTVIEQWVDVESDAFTLQGEFFALYNQKKVARFQEAFDEMAPALNDMFHGPDAHKRARERMTAWYKQTHAVGDCANELQEAEDMKMLLESYWKTAVDRAIDSLCMRVDQHVVRGLDDAIHGRLAQLALDPAKCASFFVQEPRVREKRLGLEARLERLKRAQGLLSANV